MTTATNEDWGLPSGYNVEDRGCYYYLRDPGGYTITSVSRKFTLPVVRQRLQEVALAYKEAETARHLREAAPAMLEALKRLVSAHNAGISLDKGDHRWLVAEEAIAQATPGKGTQDG